MLYKIYDDSNLSENYGAVIFVGQFDRDGEDSPGFYLEILNNRILLERLFFLVG